MYGVDPSVGLHGAAGEAKGVGGAVGGGQLLSVAERDDTMKLYLYSPGFQITSQHSITFTCFILTQLPLSAYIFYTGTGSSTPPQLNISALPTYFKLVLRVAREERSCDSNQRVHPLGSSHISSSTQSVYLLSAS